MVKKLERKIELITKLCHFCKEPMECEKFLENAEIYHGICAMESTADVREYVSGKPSGSGQEGAKPREL